MLTIRQWFYRNAKIPILATIAGIVLVSAAYFVVWQIENHKTQVSRADRLVDLGGLAIVQSNRILLESVLQHAFYELHAEKVIFCRAGRVEVSYPTRVSSCVIQNTGIFTRLIHKRAAGQPEYEFFFYVPVISDWGLLSLVALLSGLFIFGAILTLLRLNRKMNSDLLTPLSAKIQSDTPLEILELEEIRQNNQRLNELKTKEAVSEAIVKHNARIAHDIRDPISTMEKLVGALPGSSGDLQEWSVLMADSIQQMNDISQQLLDQGRSLGTVNIEPLSVEKASVLISAVVSDKKIQLGEHSSTKVIFDPNNRANSIFVSVQPNEIRRALSNLVNNSVQAIEGSGTVKLLLKKTAEKCVILIEDNGKGIPADILPQIGVEGFSYGKSNGSGLGFYNAKKVIEAWGGSVQIDSTQRVGTRVTITLPLSTPSGKTAKRGMRLVTRIEDTAPGMVKEWVQ